MTARVKASATNSLPIEAAEAFARIFVGVMEKKPDLKLIKPVFDAEQPRKTVTGKRG